jgi:hypothetical protein
MNINISVCADDKEAKLTGIYVDADAGASYMITYRRIMQAVESAAAELVEKIQGIIDDPVGVPLDGPIYPEPLDPIDDPIPVPKPVNPPYEEM